ncbi:MAG: hypothetical protein ACR2P9_07260 [Gammaproteobacteria bacterium]
MNKVPTDFRRATMLVNEIDIPLQIYRDILGMQTYYDDEVTISGVGLPAGEPGSKARLVILQANDPYIGMLGILQYLQPPLPTPPPRAKKLGVGDTVFVMNSDDVETVHKKLCELEGVYIQSEPHVSEYPKPDGGVFRLLGMSFFDPNGYFVEINQWLDR